MQPVEADTAARLAKWLAAHMERHRLSPHEIGRELGVGAGVVRGWLSAAGRGAAFEPGEFDHLDTPVKLGAWLRARIADSGATVREIAAMTEDVSMSTIYNWLKGEHLPPPPTTDSPDRFDLLLSRSALGLDLHQRVALDRVRRRLTGAAPDFGPGAVWEPRALPAANRSFTGRRSTLRRLDRLLADYGRGTGVLVALTGIGGVGKTALAVHWARSAQVRATLTDGCLYLDLNGYSKSTPVDIETARIRLLFQLGVGPERIPADPEAQHALYQRSLAGRPLLLVLDNAHAEPQVRPLLPADPLCLTVITSRNRLSGLDITSGGLTRVAVDALGPDEAAALLRELLGRLIVRHTSERDFDAFAEACGRLPLALRIAAANYLTHHHPHRETIADYTRLLEADRLGALAIGPTDPETAITVALDHSHHRLSSGAQRAYRLLGLHRAPDFSIPWVVSVLAESTEHVRGSLRELVQANLLSVDANGRHSFHDLLREHAAGLAEREEDAADRHGAVERGLDHWLHSGFAAFRTTEPSRVPIVLEEPFAGVAPESFEVFDDASAWLDAELPGVLAAVAHAAEAGHDRHVWRLAWTVMNKLGTSGLWGSQRELARLVLEAGDRLGDLDVQARGHRFLASAAIFHQAAEQARFHLERALRLHRESGDLVGQAAVQHALSYVEESAEGFAAALGHARQALLLERASGSRPGQARALNEIGWLSARLGNPKDGVEPCLEALAIFEELGDRTKIAHTLDSLGYLRHRMGDLPGAIGDFEQALDLFRSVGNAYEEAGTLGRIGDVHADEGDRDAAECSWREALDLYTEMGHGHGESMRERLRGSGA
ncbi:tetratricopeptide repeat protein [Phytomonospora sp. NPDC050363]|uniref:tetratricopeptide repeat protein n=1 Tax=Phytomonospora sp. NPDC050363 TaxID=3155642 RepID=UPI003409329E